MNTKMLKKVIITAAVAALFLVPMSFVILQTNTSKAKDAKAYNPYATYNPYLDQQETNNTFGDNPTNFVDPFDSFNTYHYPNGESIGVSDFNQPPVFDNSGDYSYSNDYQADNNCNYYFSSNCSNFPLTPQPNYGAFVEQEPYIFDVPPPKTYDNFYNPYQPNLQDPLKPWYPEQDFDFDNGYFNS